MRPVCCVTSDLHLPGAAEAVLGHVARLNRKGEVREVVLVGDRTIEPDLAKTGGRNLLREAKERAKAAGLSVVEEEERLWQGAEGPVLVEQWLGAVERTAELHLYCEYLVRSGALPRLVDTGGNDADKERRVVRAAELAGREGLSLLAILARSFAFRRVGGVEQRLAGETLAIDIPYLAGGKAELKRLAQETAAVLAANQPNAKYLTTIVFRAHLNSDPALRREPHCAWYQEVFALARRLYPLAELIHVCGHSHKLPEPYRFGEVLVVPVGYGKEDATQRLLVMDYFDRRGWWLLDFDIAGNRLLRERKLGQP